MYDHRDEPTISLPEPRRVRKIADATGPGLYLTTFGTFYVTDDGAAKRWTGNDYRPTGITVKIPRQRSGA